jgi:hypothetical protein
MVRKNILEEAMIEKSSLILIYALRCEVKALLLNSK